MRDIFGNVEGATSYTRFNEWYVGEIFVNHEELIPNARRDGFEDTKVWVRAKMELVTVCKEKPNISHAGPGSGANC